MSLPSEKSKAPRLQKNGQRQQFLQQTNRNRKNVVSIGFSGSGSQIFHFQSAGERPDALRALNRPVVSSRVGESAKTLISEHVT